MKPFEVDQMIFIDLKEPWPMPKDDDEKREAEERKHMLMKKTIHTASHGKITLPVSCTEKSFGFTF